ncbi:MAG: nitroreductase family deazaflavin-dependent oxidoreductase [Anaerolineaceae bacterium]
MPEKISEPKLPNGLSRFAFRFPIWLYHAHLGWILGTRFVLLTHTGRKSGLPRQTVLEVVRYDQTTGACIVASGWNTKSDWFKNVVANPKIIFQVKNKRLSGIAERLAPEKGSQELFEYARHYPLAFRELARFMGYRVDGSEEDIREVGRMIPMFLFKPIVEVV